jgi:MinD-like ATPase involved in chromosome partitioning or flagellar assembly
VRLADYALVVTSHDPAAVVDGYAMIKVITAVDRAKPIGVIVNATADADQGALVFRQISLATERFLGRSVRYDGHVVHDRSVTDAALAQVPLVSSDQSGPASRCIRRLACRLVASRPTGSGPWGAPRPAVAVPPALVGQAGGVPPARGASGQAQGAEAPRCA